MKRRLCSILLLLALCCGGCTAGPSGADSPAPAPVVETDLDRLADAQLGLLAGRITETERERVLLLLGRLEPLRQERLAAGRWEKSEQEVRLLRQLNQLYERCTARYLGEIEDWAYSVSAEYTLAEYRIVDGGELRPVDLFDSRGYDQEEYAALWERACALLPEGALHRFSRFVVFTDGLDGTLAYVSAVDASGSRWELALDPADAEDDAWFTETLLHEYTHALTLNDTQVTYTSRQTTDTYNEAGMVALDGSYLDDFYQAFWTDILDDRLAAPDSSGFFLRHEDDFVTDYAATDPSEDIAESFTYFLLWPPMEGEDVWERKLNFFYDYPELVEFRTQVRAHLGLDEDDSWP